MIDPTLTDSDVVAEAVEKGRHLVAGRGDAFRRIKRDRVAPLEREILERLDEKEKNFVDCWFSDTARAGLTEILETFRRPGPSESGGD